MQPRCVINNLEVFKDQDQIVHPGFKRLPPKHLIDLIDSCLSTRLQK